MSISVKVLAVHLFTGALLVIAAGNLAAMDGPDAVELETLSNIYMGVTFDHAMHTEMASCAACHHHTTGMPAEDTKCLDCHKTSTETDEVACQGCHTTNPGKAEKMKGSQQVPIYHSDATGLKRAYHLQCLGCHREMEAASGCEDCHPRKEQNPRVSQVND